MIACRVFNRELSYFAALSKNVVQITWLPQGLHDTPELLRKMVIENVGKLHREMERDPLRPAPDAIVLGYGLCSNGVAGVRSYEIPIVVPRTDDCIGIFLGSEERYLRLFREYGGTYWLNNGWIESAFIPSREMLEKKRRQYERDYGGENADYLMEQDLKWSKSYKYCGYIDSPVYRCPENPETARRVAAHNGWQLVRFDGDMRLLQKMVDGDWNEEEFLICPPNHRIEATNGPDKLRAVPAAN